MTKKTDTNKTPQSITMHSILAEPAPLGLSGLAIAALVLASTDLGLASNAAKSLMIPWTLFLGATAQLVAGTIDYKRNNVFGATAFTTYSFLWYSVSLTLFITIFTDVSFDLTHYAYGLLGFLFFSIILTIASMRANMVFFTILIFIDAAIITLITHILMDSSAFIVGIFLILVSIGSFYGVAATLFNSMAGKTILPMGSALWKS